MKFKTLKSGDVVYKMSRNAYGEIKFDKIDVLEHIGGTKTYKVKSCGLNYVLSFGGALMIPRSYTALDCIVLTKSEYDAIKHALNTGENND